MKERTVRGSRCQECGKREEGGGAEGEEMLAGMRSFGGSVRFNSVDEALRGGSEFWDVLRTLVWESFGKVEPEAVERSQAKREN
uniref:Uncharacterized protein n=1 Tax=Chromera velia CCMP2878 TaxID=1169474 RepID=A0A0G4HV90_9ALVE|eukprot:Cvel_32105.t1-p1 / transcript=Cvel_32105.t1 / gene=Cvel_32105 / organism=Chromera_velia_CCMP2878 / gene_product=hypothetical protein / transcript_product=hypothetical protein / location=Cvel_scaffold4916:4336-4584(+) / protein_length=83 / sequence_SO=supercontig / SO=protein_coding / is_pseudo=false